MSNLEGRRAAESTVAQQWAMSDPQAATRWAATLPPNESVNAIGGAARLWAQQDATTAGEFLNSLGGTVRDEAVASFSAALSVDNSASALTWVATISDSAIRQKSLSAIAGEWMRNDPAAATAWIQKSALSEAEKSSLLPPTAGP